MSLKSQLLENKDSRFNKVNWKKVSELLKGKFIHSHSETAEAEIQVGNDHILIEDEDGKLQLCIVKKISNDIFDGEEMQYNEKEIAKRINEHT